MKRSKQFSAETLARYVIYCAETGVFVWRETRGSRARRGDVAGSVYSTTGYRMIPIEGAYYCAHRLAWLWVYGVWPEGNIDHVNGQRTDNRISNLRDGEQKQNSQNQRRAHADKMHGSLMGCTWDKVNRTWKAQLTLNKRCINLGRFSTEGEAHYAYLEGKRRLHAGCTI